MSLDVRGMTMTALRREIEKWRGSVGAIFIQGEILRRRVIKEGNRRRYLRMMKRRRGRLCDTPNNSW